MDVPTIYGYKVGINNQGILNFYDGKIQGITPIQGNVTDTPEEYGPVSTEYDNGITTIQLGIVTGYEARIEWVYYTILQDAIDAAKKGDTVTILKDIQLKDRAEVSVIKNVILELHGYELTIVSGQDIIINNYGNLKITDNSVEQTGNIMIDPNTTNTCYGIYNNSNGSIEFINGRVSSIGYYNYGIYNASAGTVIMTGGTVSSSSYSNSYGLYNAGAGKVIMTGGTVSSSSSNNYDYSYGIYNASSGTITITGGTINSSSNHSSYGIYNERTGIITVSGGTVSSDIRSNVIYNNSSYGIYNNNTGIVQITGGTVSSGNDNTSRIYGLYNKNTGIVQLTGGTVTSSTTDRGNGIYNESSGTVEITGGILSNYYYGIYNSSTGSIKVTGGIVSNNSYGIYNKSSGIVEVTGGTVSSNSYGIYNAGAGTIIIGYNESGIATKENPYIKGEYIGTSKNYNGYGVYNCLGNLEFYKGIIQGDIALLGNITKIREGYKIEKSTIEEKESIYLIEKTNAEYIVQIEKNKYYSLQEAIDSIGEEEKTIEIIKNFELEEKINFNKNVILDLNGYTITNNYYRIENTGNLIINDLTENKEGKIGTVNDIIIGLLNKENGNVTVIGGTVNINSNNQSYGIYNSSTGKVIISGGTINSSGNSKSCGIYNASTGNVTVSGGTVSGGTVSSSVDYSIGICNASTGNVTVSGGTVISSSKSNSYGVYNISSGKVIITRGIVSSKSNGTIYASYCHGIYNCDTGIVQVIGGTVSCSSENSSRGYGIYNYGTGIVQVTGGTVSSSSSGYGNYGIYNYKTGSITIGTKGDGMISQEEPNINAEYTGTTTGGVGYGIYNTKGKLYFYDGKIEGTTKAVYDTITEKEDNTEFNYNEDETILTLTTEATPVAQIEDTTYATLKEAINSVGEEQTTIKILRNVVYTINDTAITISSTKNIILDLNGYQITSSIPKMVIQNEGTLEIIDTSNEQTGNIVTNEEKTINNISGAKLVISGGTIENRTNYAIYNEGDAIIKKGIVKSSSSNSNNDSYGIYNVATGNVSIIEGTVSSSTPYGDYGIYNESTGTIEITGGVISKYSYGIYNYSTGSIKVTGGTISAIYYGIYNVSTGTIEMAGGTISSNDCGIYNKSTGPIIIGIKGTGGISQENPSITATKPSSSSSFVTYGIYNPNGTLEYYDGVIKANTQSVYGNIAEIEDETELLISSETIDSKSYEVLTLQQKEANVASVNNVEYDSIQKAIEACGTTESTITILRDSAPGATIIIGEDQNITIDLNGYTINNYTELRNKGRLKITDSSEVKTGKIVGLTGMAISNSANMELIDGSITDSGYGIKNTGTLNVTGGNITNNIYGIYNSTRGILILTNGTILSNTYGVYNYSSSSNINITGGTISSNEYGIYNYNGTTNISGTGFTSNTYGVYNAGGTTNIKEDVEVQSNIGTYVSGGILNIGETGTMDSSSPVIIGEKYGLSVASTGTVYMYDGQIKGKTGATQGFITYTEEGYQVANKTEGEYSIDYLALAGTVSTVAQVNGINFSNLQSAINSITEEEAQTITLTNVIISDITFTIAEGQNIILDMNGKTISSDLEVTINNSGNLTIIDSSGNNVAKISSTVGTAIVNSGTLTLGQDDGTVEQDILTIDGTTYGIENTGTLNFYDGTINGGSAVNGTITNRPDGYVIRTTTVNSKERYYLST